jgi:ribosome biogenesis GTPase / thiamine phosphate phosphatase
MSGRPPLSEGLVVAGHGRQLAVEDDARTRHTCRLHGRGLNVVCGDRVGFAYATPGDSQATVYELRPRRSLLERLTALGRREPVVANLSQIVVVIAVQPRPDWSVVDRYLAGAEWAGLRAAIALNKCDLRTASLDELGAELAGFAALGYPVLDASTRGPPGLAALAGTLRGEASVLVGQSGTGKSSLLNALVPAARAVTQEISAATAAGRHTTTTSALHHLDGGGELIDSPGVRDYAPPLPALSDVGQGFREIAALAPNCRFKDCRHVAEPGCAVRSALASRAEMARRYESYRRLLELTERFAVQQSSRSQRPRGR